MRFQTPLLPGRLIRRYKRFLADVKLDDGREVIAHCANPGAMIGLKDPGLRVWLEPNDDPQKKLKFAWRIAQLKNQAWVGIDTGIPNRLVKEALSSKSIPEFAAYATIQPEQKYGKDSRVDFLLTHIDHCNTYIEVKNVHLWRGDDWAEFPDTVTARGLKHLGVLGDMAEAGHRAVLLYCVQHTGCARFRLAADLDPAYADACALASKRGVEMLCFSCNISPHAITLGRPMPIFPTIFKRS